MLSAQGRESINREFRQSASIKRTKYQNKSKKAREQVEWHVVERRSQVWLIPHDPRQSLGQGIDAANTSTL